MKDFKKRLEQIETKTQDWAAQLDIVDYLGLTDYENGEWEEVFFDNFITVVRHRITGEIRGVYNDRRTGEEIIAMGGDLAYL